MASNAEVAAVRTDPVAAEILTRLADLPTRCERTEAGGLNRAQLDMLIESARALFGQPVRRPDYDR